MKNPKDVFEKYESNVRSYCRAFPAVFCKAKDTIISDLDGNDYIDFFCGAGSVNYGHNNDYIKAKMVNFLENDGLLHALDMMTEAKADFIEYFQKKILKPRGMNYKILFPNSTGTNAIEVALKLARKYTGRSDIWCLMGCFHGMTLGSLALTSDAKSRDGAGVPLSNVVHIPAPYMFDELDTIKYMETIINDDHSGYALPAAIIIETVQAEGGIHVMSNEYLQAIRILCDKYGILLIIDDIQVGCARTGTYFSFERAGIKPDIFVMAKSISGAGLPFAIVLTKEDFDVLAPGQHNGTFRGNQLAMVAAKAGLEYMLIEKVEEQVKRKEAIVRDYLNTYLPSQFKFRGIGLIWGIEVTDNEMCSKITTKCFDNGLIIEKAGRDNNVLKIMPPLIINDEMLIKGLSIIVNAINELCE
ncbi:MAG: diaminobutyrate--2-oxoglutarate transaminase [Lachnospiraceae bacterium]|nr:diaminobutyrate--2-oxoglutarate transaminase [Lachnospiraceae bacterium]